MARAGLGGRVSFNPARRPHIARARVPRQRAGHLPQMLSLAVQCHTAAPRRMSPPESSTWPAPARPGHRRCARWPSPSGHRRLVIGIEHVAQVAGMAAVSSVARSRAWPKVLGFVLSLSSCCSRTPLESGSRSTGTRAPRGLGLRCLISWGGSPCPRQPMPES
jgi:hypothetical protein